jgi:hypothetical protein
VRRGIHRLVDEGVIVVVASGRVVVVSRLGVATAQLKGPDVGQLVTGKTVEVGVQPIDRDARVDRGAAFAEPIVTALGVQELGVEVDARGGRAPRRPRPALPGPSPPQNGQSAAV